MYVIFWRILVMAQIKVEELRFYCCSTFMLRAQMLCFLLQSAYVSSLLQQNHLIMYTIYKHGVVVA